MAGSNIFGLESNGWFRDRVKSFIQQKKPAKLSLSGLVRFLSLKD